MRPSSSSSSCSEAECPGDGEDEKKKKDEEEGEDETPLTTADLFSQTFTLRKQLDHKLLDDRVLKALKKQEEKKEKRLARKKEVTLS